MDANADRELKDIFEVQQEIAKSVAESLRVTLLGSEEKSMQIATNSVKHTTLQARFHSQRGNVEIIVPLLTSIVQSRDPNYALAYAERSVDACW